MAEIQGIPPPSSSEKPTPSLKTLKSWIPLYIQKTDTNLLHLTRILSTPTGIDKFLLLTCYSTLLTSSLLTKLLARLRRPKFLAETITTKTTLTTTLLYQISPPRKSVRNLAVTAKSLKALSSLISDFRIFVRLWGGLGIYTWARSIYHEPPNDKVIRGITYLQLIVNAAFQTLENGAYLASKGVLGWSEKKQNSAWLWSCRFWATHVLLEVVRLGYIWRRGKEEGEGDEWTKEEKEGWWRELGVNLAWAPLTAHWSLEGGLLEDFGVGMLGSWVGVVGMKRLWRDTA